MNNILIVIGIFLLSFMLTWLVRKWAIYKDILDHPNDRSSHTIPTPRGGGIAIVVAFYTGLILLLTQNHIEKSLFYALLCGIPLALIGYIDDMFNLKPGVRFFIQFSCAIAALVFLSGFQYFDLGFYVFDYAWILTIIAIIAIVWAINLFNFLDGIDGYLASEIIFLGFAAFILTGESAGFMLIASCAGFLIWNWQKAKIFMGDVGSTLLGFCIAVLAIYHQNTIKLSIICWLILTVPFWMDATLTLIRRFKNKENLSKAHRKHAFQRIVQAGWSHQRTVICLLLVNLMNLILVYLAIKFPAIQIFMLIISIVLFYAIILWVDNKRPFIEA